MEHKNILSYIAKDIQKTCERLGIYAEFTPKSEKLIESSDFKVQPSIFESIHIEVNLYLETDEDDDTIDITACLRYRYTHWDGGENGCSLGSMEYHMLKSNYNNDRAYLDSSLCLIEKSRGLTI